jgi:hypothetical protein
MSVKLMNTKEVTKYLDVHEKQVFGERALPWSSINKNMNETQLCQRINKLQH